MIVLPARRLPLFCLAALLLIGTECMVIRSTTFVRNPAPLSLAVLFDLVVILPGLFHYLVARPNGWGWGRTVLLGLVMGRAGLFVLPATALPSMLGGPAPLLVLEGVALAVAVVRGRVIVGTYRRLRLTADPDKALYGAFEAVFGNTVAGIIVGEWLIVRCALLSWRHADVPAGATPITTHRELGQVALLMALGAVCVIELVATHLLLTRWNTDVALWVTLLSAYGLLFLVAEIRTTVNQPTYLTASALHLRVGVRWQAVIPRTRISRVLFIQDKPASQPGLLNATLLTTPNVVLVLTGPTPIRGPYGITRTVTQLALFVDGRSTFPAFPGEIH